MIFQPRVKMTDSKWTMHRLAQEAWKIKNKERYLKQKKECAAHPGYLAQRRATYKARSTVEKTSGETKEIYESEDKASNRSEYFGWPRAKSAKWRNWVGTAWDGEIEEGLGQSLGEFDDEWDTLLQSDESADTEAF